MVSGAANSEACRGWVRTAVLSPLIWYGAYVVILGVIALAIYSVALPSEATERLIALVAASAVLPPVVVTVIVASHLPTGSTRPPSALQGPVRWAIGAVWASVTFAIGAFIAALAGFDLEHVNSAASTNEYFYGFVVLIVISVSLIAMMTIAAASAWACLRADEQAFSRAAIRALVPTVRRDRLPLRTRMWLDGGKDHLGSSTLLEAVPVASRFIRVLRFASECGLVFFAILVLLVAMSVIYPLAIDLVS